MQLLPDRDQQKAVQNEVIEIEGPTGPAQEQYLIVRPGGSVLLAEQSRVRSALWHTTHGGLRYTHRGTRQRGFGGRELVGFQAQKSAHRQDRFPKTGILRQIVSRTSPPPNRALGETIFLRPG